MYVCMYVHVSVPLELAMFFCVNINAKPYSMCAYVKRVHICICMYKNK